MTHRYSLKAVEGTFRDLTHSTFLLGAKSVLLIGYFCQIPPLVQTRCRSQIIGAPVKISQLSPLFKVLHF